MKRRYLYGFIGTLTVVSCMLFGQQAPHTNRDNLLFDEVQFWGTVFDMPYGLDHETNKTAILVAEDVWMQWEEWGSFVIIGITEGDVPRQCGVTCSSGTFACCWINGGGWPRCRCIPNAEDDEHCLSGGHRSTSCEVTRGGDIEATP